MILNPKSLAGRFSVEIQKIWWELTHDDEFPESTVERTVERFNRNPSTYIESGDHPDTYKHDPYKRK